MNHFNYKIRVAVNIGMLLLLLIFTLQNTSSLLTFYPESATTLYIHSLLFNSLVLLAIAIHNLYLIPQLLFKKRKILYCCSFLLLLLLTTIASSAYMQYLLAHYPESDLNHFSVFAIEFVLIHTPFIAYYSLAFVHVLFYIMLFGIPNIIRRLYTHNKTLQLSKSEQLKAELQVLKAQINPHFLFNMMNSIYALSLKKSDDTPEVILKLSEIIRYNLYETNVPAVLLTKELHIIENYIALECIRLNYPEKIKWENRLSAQDMMISPMLLLPIVENAFKHGIDSNTAQGYIHMKAYNNAEAFIFECANNYKKKNNISTHSGLGLSNLKRRLQLIYPEKHHLYIQQTDTTFEIRLEIKIAR
jgi:two-component system LytT family sensor kinase